MRSTFILGKLGNMIHRLSLLAGWGWDAAPLAQPAATARRDVWRQLRTIVHAGVTLLFVLAPTISKGESDPIDPRLKVAYVYNFLKFVEWPGQSGLRTVLLCVANADGALDSAFAALNGRLANGRPITVRSLATSSDFTSCNAIYISDGAVRKILDQLSSTQNHFLTIGDAENFVDSGGMIGLMMRDGRLQFEINLKAARQADFLMSAQLLKLAYNTQ